MQEDKFEYVGFWPRVGASLIDSLLLLVVTCPLLVAIYGWSYYLGSPAGLRGTADFLLSWVLPAAAVVAFWFWKQATPGKMAISARIVDAATGKAPSSGQMVLRYLGYFVSTIPLCLGFFWIAFDRRKQGWHDKLARTVVVRPAHRGPDAVRFEQA